MSTETQKLNKGFSLIELIIAIAIFIAVMTIATGAVFSVLNSNIQSKNTKTALSNLNLALESMSREIRFGTVYHCGNSGILTSPQDCPSGNSYFTFLSSEGQRIVYQRSGSAVRKSVNGGSYVSVTSPEINIQNLTFYTIGSSSSDNLQPKTVIIVRGTVGTRAITRFAIQTLVSQRVIDR